MSSVQESLDSAQNERSENGKARIVSLDTLQKNAATYRLDIEEKAESVRISADAASHVSSDPGPRNLSDILTVALRL